MIINVKLSQTPEGKFKLWGGWGGVKLPKLCRHRDRKQSCDSSVHTQCKLYRGLSPCEHIRHNTAIHHSRQACQIERGQVFLVQDDVLTLFLVSILTNLRVHSPSPHTPFSCFSLWPPLFTFSSFSTSFCPKRLTVRDRIKPLCNSDQCSECRAVERE